VVSGKERKSRDIVRGLWERMDIDYLSMRCGSLIYDGGDMKQPLVPFRKDGFSSEYFPAGHVWGVPGQAAGRAKAGHRNAPRYGIRMLTIYNYVGKVENTETLGWA
jgi:hypothetical protein